MSPEPSKRRDNRRTHRKSRKGCLVCKKRRVKCDEQRPRCGNCDLGDRACSYSDTTPIAHTSTGRLDASSAGSNCDGLVASPSVVGSSTVGVGGTFTTIHMSLLHHAHARLNVFLSLRGDILPIIDTAVNSAFDAPYLLDQLLALSALHQSVCAADLEMASIYHHQATELQTRALGLFNEARDDISESHSVPSFLFATFLGIHVLHGTLATLSSKDTSLSAFVGDFVGYVHLHLGVRTVIKGHWPRILESSLKPLLYFIDWMEKEEFEVLAQGPETIDLARLLESSSHSAPSSIEACLSAAKWAQWVLGVAALQPLRNDLVVHAIMAWPLIIPEEFIEALYQNRPEALVVLAHYGAILHRFRAFWVFGDSGSALIRAIAEHVGSFWAEALVWPQQSLLEPS